MKQFAVNLATAARLTATTTSAAVEVSDYTGMAKLVLNASATEAADNTLDVKLQHSRDDGATDPYTDAGVAFAQVTNAGASHQTIDFSVDGLKKYVKVVSTLGGTTPAVTRSVELIANKAY